ncbi:HPr kinase/phosphorylase [Azospirillum sp.]|uniref:HPr kinase/phosphorylase n=1 Tax=Azospirillum sp. TaxID=34012 RepID=UPI003D71DE49
MIYTLCGLKIASDLPVPELLPWIGDARVPDVEFRMEAASDGPAQTAAPPQVSGAGAHRFSVPGVATYAVEAGRRVTIRPCPGTNEVDLRVFLLGTAFGLLCHQRGLLPLHAGCVAIGGRAVAFSGESGEGKSTLVGAFLRRGFPALADDVTVVDTRIPGFPVLPSVPRVKLKRDAAVELGLPTVPPDINRTDPDKLHVAMGTLRQVEPLPLAAIYHLSTHDGAGCPRIERLRGIASVDSLIGAVYRGPLALRMGLRKPMLSAVMRLAVLPSYRLCRARALDALDATVSAIAAAHGA